MTKSFKVLLMALICLSHNGSHAASLASNSSNRMDHQAGGYLSLLGDPVGLFGANAAYHPTDFMRVVGGVGFTPATGPILNSAFSVGTGIKFLVPTWNFTPVIGTNVSLLFVGSTNGLISYENLGFEYTASNGFHIGAGINGLFVAAGSTDAVDRVLPYINMGVFF